MRGIGLPVLGVAALFGFGLPAARVALANEGSADAVFQMMDTNGDGKISREEHAAGAKHMFDTMDADQDG